MDPDPPDPPDPPDLPDPPDPPDCIPTHSGVCLAPDQFDRVVAALGEAYRETPNFRNQWGLDAIRAHRAYAHLETLEGEGTEPGSGVTIGFIDSGIDQQHPMFAGSSVFEEFLLGATDETVAGFSAGDFSHGTAVASVAAGRPVSASDAPQGVAWSADIAMFAIPLGSSGPVFQPISVSGLAGLDSRWGELISDVLGWRDGIDVLNLSIGFQGIADNYSEHDLRSSIGAVIDAMAQRGASDRTIFVWAAGNSHGLACDTSTSNPHCVNGTMDAASVDVLAGLAARIPELRGHTIAVVALQRDASGTEIAGFSNRCGIAADYCIAAPGADVRYAYFGEAGRRTASGRGTSFAAPMVSGGLALMTQLFRDQLSSAELVERLLVTADNTGRFADRSIYGRGLMDLEAATSPVGVLDVPETGGIGGHGSPLRATTVRPGAPFGDGFGQSFSGREVVALDDLGAPFWFDLGSFAIAEGASPLSTRLRDFMAPSAGLNHASSSGTGIRLGDFEARFHDLTDVLRLGFVEAPRGVERGHLGLAGRSLALSATDRRAWSGTAFTTGGEFGQEVVSGASVSLRTPASPLGLRAGWLEERESLLGSSASGAFGALASDAVFAGLRFDGDFGEWGMSANAEIGTVSSAVRGGVITAISPLTTTAFSLHANRAFDDGESLRLTVSQPLRVERGRASLSLPSGRTKAGDVLRSSFSADIAPSGRQIDFAAQWSQTLSSGELRLGAVLTRQTGHRTSEALELTVLSGWRRRF